MKWFASTLCEIRMFYLQATKVIISYPSLSLHQSKANRKVSTIKLVCYTTGNKFTLSTKRKKFNKKKRQIKFSQLKKLIYDATTVEKLILHDEKCNTGILASAAS